MTIIIGAEKIGGAVAEAAAPAPKKSGGRPTKAELIAQAEALGIEVPEGATNPEIKALIERAEAPAVVDEP